MPIYDFRCEEHGDFDQLCRMGVTSFPCPECGAMCEKLISRPAPCVMGSNVRVPKEVDMKIGASSDRNWERYHERWDSRAAGKELVTETSHVEPKPTKPN